MAESHKQITKIVLTGGPCGGKSSAIDRIKEFLTEHGYHVFAVPEAATLLFVQGGIPIHEAKWPYMQRMIAKVQHNMELAYYQYATDLLTLAPNTPIVMIMDRGIFDGKAYIDDTTFCDYLQYTIPGVDPLKTDEVMNEKYDMILHLTTAAKGAERFYRTEIFRNESPTEARALDAKMLKIYKNHRDRRVIDNEGSFEDKLNAVIAAIADKLDITNDEMVMKKDAPSIPSIPSFPSFASSDDHKTTKLRKRSLNLPTGHDADDCKDTESTDNMTYNQSDDQLNELREKNKKQQLEIERLKAQLAAINALTTNEQTQSVVSTRSNNHSSKADQAIPKGIQIEMEDDSGGLKVWMEQMDLWDETLYGALLAKNVKSHHLLRAFPQNELHHLLRNIRADKITNLKNQNARNSIDEKLVRFEKACRGSPRKSTNHK